MQNLTVTQCILSLASNFHAEQNLALARTILSQPSDDYIDIRVQTIEHSPVIFSQDKNSSVARNLSSVSVYHNQIAWLSFASPITWERLNGFTKSLERMALRHEFAKPIISLDVDILAICTTEKRTLNSLMANAGFIPLLSYYHSLFNSQGQIPIIMCRWYGITRRFPLANYDRYGINYLVSQYFANNVPLLPIL